MAAKLRQISNLLLLSALMQNWCRSSGFTRAQHIVAEFMAHKVNRFSLALLLVLLLSRASAVFAFSQCWKSNLTIVLNWEYYKSMVQIYLALQIVYHCFDGEQTSVCPFDWEKELLSQQADAASESSKVFNFPRTRTQLDLSFFLPQSLLLTRHLH